MVYHLEQTEETKVRYLLSSCLAALVTFVGAGGALAETIILRAGHSATVTEPYHKGLERFAEIVAERTGGKVKVEIFPNNQLGNEKEMIEGLQLGTLDITVPTNGVLTNFVPELSIFDLPFLFKSRGQMDRVLDGEVGAILSEKMEERGFSLLGFYDAGVRHLITKREINSYDDLANLKMRTMGIPIHIASFNKFGANATSIPYGELYSALQSGVVDGAEAGYVNYYAQHFYEVAPFLAEIGWTTLVADLIMSKSRLDSLPEDIRKVVIEAGLESAVFERELYRGNDDTIKEELVKLGVKITTPDPAPFLEASKSIYESYATDDFKRGLLNSIQSAN